MGIWHSTNKPFDFDEISDIILDESSRSLISTLPSVALVFCWCFGVGHFKEVAVAVGHGAGLCGKVEREEA